MCKILGNDERGKVFGRDHCCKNLHMPKCVHAPQLWIARFDCVSGRTWKCKRLRADANWTKKVKWTLNTEHKSIHRNHSCVLGLTLTLDLDLDFDSDWNNAQMSTLKQFFSSWFVKMLPMKMIEFMSRCYVDMFNIQCLLLILQLIFFLF